MARYIHPEIKSLAQDPEGSHVRLAIVPTEGEVNTVKSDIEETGANIDQTLPSGVLIVDVAPEELSELFKVESVESISPNSTMETLA